MTDAEKRKYIFKRIKSIGRGVIGFEYINTDVRKMLDYDFEKGHLKLDEVYEACVSAPDGNLGLVIYFDFITHKDPIFKITEDDHKTMLYTCIELEKAC